MTPSSPPAWLAELTQSVSTAMIPTDVLPPIGCHCYEQDGLWEVTVFVAKTEVIGGERDGYQFSAEFVLDVGKILALFSDVRSVRWQALRHDADDEIGAHIALEGDYCGRALLLRVPAHAPKRFDVGRHANVNNGRFVDIW